MRTSRLACLTIVVAAAMVCTVHTAIAFPGARNGQSKTAPARREVPADRRPLVPDIEPPADIVRWVPSSRVVLSFQAAPGSSAVTAIEAWYTEDRALSWKPWPTRVNPADRSVTFEAPHEGLYGFYIILHNAFGPSDEPPQPGIAPHQWVRVDRTPPRVQILELRPDPGFINNREVIIRWDATEDGMPDRPVRLHYRAAGDLSYRLIDEDLAARSTYRWVVPEGVTGHVIVKVSAVDRAGNVGWCVNESLEIGTSEESREPPRHRMVDGGTRDPSNEDPTTPSPSHPAIEPIADERPIIPADPIPDRHEPLNYDASQDAPAGPMFSATALVDPPAMATSNNAASAKAKKRYDLGTRHRLQGENALAMVRYREALKLDPKMTAARSDLASLLFLAGRNESAERELERALAIDPRYLPALKSLSLVQASLRKYRSSQETLDRILAIDAKDSEAWLYLGDVTMFRGDRLAARQDWSRVLELDTTTPELRERAEKRLAIYRSDRLAVGAGPEP